MSRSGRVCKKPSKLMDFQSPDDIEAKQKKLPVSHRQSAKLSSSQVRHAKHNVFLSSLTFALVLFFLAG